MAECPNKAAYQFMDLDTRTAAFFNIPFKMREDPFRMIGVIGSLKQQRFITAVLKVNNNDIIVTMMTSRRLRSIRTGSRRSSGTSGSGPGARTRMCTLLRTSGSSGTCPG